MASDADDDKTVIRGAPRAAAPPAGDASSDNALPIGTRIGEFEIVGLVGVGGFGIVYLARDESLGRRVALKEYMPQTLAARSDGVTVAVRSARQVDTFQAGLRSFVNEARLLAQFDHPSLVKVYRFWEANGTAYMVMPYYQGRTLKDALKAMQGPPDEAWLKRMLAAVLDALEAMHEQQVFHRDIAPDNILLLPGDRPLLLDFGAARHVISDLTQALTVILKPGYAPIEQYAEVPDLKQGAWTDLYALAAVVYTAITGRPPLPSVGRMVNDSMVPLARQAAGRYSESFLGAVDAALAIKPSERPQTAAQWRTMLELPEFALSTMPADLSQRGAEASKVRRSHALVWGGAALALGGAAVAAFMLWPVETPPAQTPAAATPADAAPGPAAASATAAASAPVAAAAVTAAAPAPAPTAPERPFNALDELDRIFEQRDRSHNVSVTMARAQVTIGRDKLAFNVRSSKGGYVYVLMVGTDRQHFYLLFPNQVDADNRVAAGGQLELPRKGWSMVAGGPAGSNQFAAVVSESRRDFKSAGLVTVDPFAEFPLEAAARVARAAGTGASPFVGTTLCPEAGADCSAAYGAAEFTIEEVEPARR